MEGAWEMAKNRLLSKTPLQRWKDGFTQNLTAHQAGLPGQSIHPHHQPPHQHQSFLFNKKNTFSFPVQVSFAGEEVVIVPSMLTSGQNDALKRVRSGKSAWNKSLLREDHVAFRIDIVVCWAEP